MYEKNAVEFKKLHELLAGSREIIVAGHENPDGDALGAMLAFYHHLSEQGKTVLPYVSTPVPLSLQFLPGANEVVRTVPPEFGDTIIALDYGDFARTGLSAIVEHRPFHIVTLDHHPGGTHLGEVQIVDISAAATCEIAYRYFRTIGIDPRHNMATCLLTGIFFDTGGFKHSNTSSGVLEIAADLIRRGALLQKITHYAHPHRPVSVLKLWARALERVAYDAELDMGYSVIYHQDITECSCTEEDLGGLTFLVSTMSESRFSVFISEVEPEKFRISLRSEAFKDVDVSAIAERLGGGGHRYASGCRLEGAFPEVFEKIREAAKAALAANA